MRSFAGPGLRAWALACAGLTFALAGAAGATALAGPGDDSYTVAAGHYAAKRWDLAAEEFAALLAEHPNHRQAIRGRFYLAESLVQLGRLSDARDEYRTVVAAGAGHPVAPQAAFRAAEMSYLTGDLDDARRRFEEFRRDHRDHDLDAYGLPYLGKIALAEGRADEAADLFERALADHPHGAMQDDCRYGLAQAAEERGDVDTARGYYLALAAKFQCPLSDDAQLRLGLVEDAAGNHEAALAAFEEFDRTFDDSPLRDTARLASAWALLHAARLGEAQARFAELLDRPELAIDARHGLALAHQSQEHWAEAIAAFETLIAAAPDHASASSWRLRLAVALERGGRLDDALAGHERAIADGNPQSLPVALLGAARLRDRTGDHDEAAALYARFVEQFPDRTEIAAALYDWAWLLRRGGRLDDADSLFERIHRHHPTSPLWADATFRLAERANERAEIAQANKLLDDLDRTAPAGPIRQHSLYLRSQLAVAESRWPFVRAPLELLIEESGDSPLVPSARYWIAEAEYRQGRHAEAQRLFKALANEPRDGADEWMAIVPLRQAQCLVHQEKWNEAFEIATAIAAAAADVNRHPDVDYLLGRCHAARGEFDKARKAYRKAIESPAGANTETAAQSQWMIGETYFHQRDFSAAVREYLRGEILYAFPQWQAASLVQAGKCRERLGKPSDAAELYRRAVENYPDTPFAAEAATRLEALTAATAAVPIRDKR